MVVKLKQLDTCIMISGCAGNRCQPCVDFFSIRSCDLSSPVIFSMVNLKRVWKIGTSYGIYICMSMFLFDQK